MPIDPQRDYGAELTKEAARWAKRLDATLKGASALTDEGKRFITNIKAYRTDAHHFAKEGDMVRAFECVVWAWAWLEIGAQSGALRVPGLDGSFV